MSGMPYAQQELKQRIEQAVLSANAYRRPVIASYSWEVETAPPFLSGQEERFYFADRERTMRAIGFGIAHRLTAKGPDRFQRIQTKWTALKREALGEDLFAFTGFSFSEMKAVDYRWTSFDEATMFIPKYLYREQKGKKTMTANAFVLPEESADQVLTRLSAEHAETMNGRPAAAAPLTIHLLRDGNEAFEAAFSQAAQLLQSTLQKIVLAREVVYELSATPDFPALLHEIERSQPGSYIFLFQPNAGEAFIGATPERLVKKEGQHVETAAVAGSARRGTDAEADDVIGQSLLDDGKNLFEHRIVVDSIKTTLSDMTTLLDVPAEPVLLKNRHIQHLHTPITGLLKTDQTLFHVIGNLHPTPALGGEPKLAAMEAIRELEGFERGWYGSPVGWIDQSDDGEFIVAIRSALITEKSAVLYAGCGLVPDSVYEEELAETETKLSPMLSAMNALCVEEKDDVYVD